MGLGLGLEIGLQCDAEGWGHQAHHQLVAKGLARLEGVDLGSAQARAEA